MNETYPILEFDPDRDALLDPGNRKPADVPEHCVLCFCNDVVEQLAADRRGKIVTHLKSEMGNHPLYEIDWQGRRLGIIQPGLTAPFAAALMEELIGLGGRKFVVCGGAGVLDGELAVGHFVVPTAAVRAEGTSYHYLPASREVQPSPQAVAVIKATLAERGAPYVLGKTWTTDAIYRETRSMVARRRAEGCLTVEMEAAALFAVAQFRNVVLGQILYAGDDVSGEVWDHRGWHHRGDIRQTMLDLAADACLRL